LHTPLVDACRALIRARLSALADEVSGSARLFESALRDFRELALPFEEALATIVMATVLEPTTPELRAAADAARDILVRLQAAPFSERLDALVEPRQAADASGSPRQRATASSDGRSSSTPLSR
jgi:hypothetical protein